MTRMRRDYLIDYWIMVICFLIAVGSIAPALIALWVEQWGPGVVMLLVAAANWWLALHAFRRVEAAEIFGRTGE